MKKSIFVRSILEILSEPEINKGLGSSIDEFFRKTLNTGFFNRCTFKRVFYALSLIELWSGPDVVVIIVEPFLIFIKMATRMVA